MSPDRLEETMAAMNELIAQVERSKKLLSRCLSELQLHNEEYEHRTSAELMKELRRFVEE